MGTGQGAPRVSILLLCWRDAAYIEAALQAALAQTVPCEIIVSNDASGDGTFERAQAIAAAYRGPHRVSVRCNARNLGVAGHVNEVVPLATGDIIVMMAGDDIAYPHRVARTLEAFARYPSAMALASRFDGIDEHGAPRGVSHRRMPEVFGLDYYVSAGRLVGLLGATLAFRREVFTRFGPIRGPIEDNALSLRAALLGDCVQLTDALIRYRAHAGSVSSGVFARDEPRETAKRRRYERTIAFYRGTADDLEHCLAQLPELAPHRRRDAEAVIAMYRIEADAREAMLEPDRRRWIGPIVRGLGQRGMRRKSAERALKLLVPTRFLRLG